MDASLPTAAEILADVDLSGARVLLTGATSGLGRETARVLADCGATIVAGVRDPARTGASVGGNAFEVGTLDLGSFASVRRYADAVAADVRPFDAIICNAGVMTSGDEITADGFERHIGTNHLGHVLLVAQLADGVRPGGRVVVLSSSAHRPETIDPADPGLFTPGGDRWSAYGRSKAANALFAIELDRRLRAHGVRAVAVHPGEIQTRLDRDLPEGALRGMADRMNADRVADGLPTVDWKTIAQGAATTVWAAFVADADVVGGRYCEDVRVAATDDDPASMTGARSYLYDAGLASALWTASEVAIGGRV